VSGAVDALDETIKEIRSTIFALQSRHEAKPLSLRARILDVVDEVTAALGFPPALELEGRLDEVPEEVGEHLLGALREGLSNAARHSGASKVEVQVRAATELSLVVRDNGSGISGTGRRSGLANLEQRASRLGGTFRIESIAAGGTELDWRVPCAL
jgi:signal transduction histidine kinase